jgi:carbamoyltransferase
MSSKILGVSAYYHDSAACLVVDGRIVAAAQEERFSRRKHDAGFPGRAVDYCLSEGGLRAEELDYVAFYDKPILKFDRLLETYIHHAPLGIRSFLKSMPAWLKHKLRMRDGIREQLSYPGPVLFTEHHQSHAASAFFPSPFERAAILTMDGVGEWATASVGRGEGNRIRVLEELHFPHSLGLLYSAFTYFLGFEVNSGEYKLMGLAPYGQPRYVDLILDELVDLRADGSLKLNMRYFDFGAGLTMTNARFAQLFGGDRRRPEGALNQREMDVAASIQAVTERAMLHMARFAHERTGLDHLVLAGGVALNCVGNGRILREGPFRDLWIQPAAGDAGGALGAALFTHHQLLDGARRVDGQRDSQQGSLLGPAYSDAELREFVAREGIRATRYDRLEDLAERVAELLARERAIGWFQGRMEFGPRALGARSILADARSPDMQRRLNLKIKFRESFRPFAPAVLREHAADFFDLDRDSPYMLLVCDIHESQRVPVPGGEARGLDKLKVVRSSLPAVTHVDGSARLQTVRREDHPAFHAVIDRFHRKTGCPVVLNTSFNLRGEPIVCTPEDAYRCFRRTNLDALVLGPYFIEKEVEAGDAAAVPPRPPAPPRPRPEVDEATEARRVALGLGIGLTVLAVVSYAAGHPLRAAVCLGVIGLVALGALLDLPAWRAVARLLRGLGLSVARALSRLILGACFYGLVTPAGLIQRLFGRRALDTAWKDRRPSYWRRARETSSRLSRYEKLY